MNCIVQFSLAFDENRPPNSNISDHSSKTRKNLIGKTRGGGLGAWNPVRIYGINRSRTRSRCVFDVSDAFDTIARCVFDVGYAFDTIEIQFDASSDLYTSGIMPMLIEA